MEKHLLEVFVAVSSGGSYLWSKDGKTFNLGQDTAKGTAICFGNDMFVAVDTSCAWSYFSKVTSNSFALKTELENYVQKENLDNYYTKTEADNKFALKNVLAAPDLSTCIKTTGPQTITSTDISQPVLNLSNTSLTSVAEGPVFKCTCGDKYFQIFYDGGAWKLENESGGGIAFDANRMYQIRNGIWNNPVQQIATIEYVDNFALKTELPDLTSYYTKAEADEKFALKTESSTPDTSNYLEKQSLEWDIDGARAILRLNALSRENGTHFFIEDSYYSSSTKGWYINSYEGKLRFRLNEISLDALLVEFSENGINFKGNKLITESEADAKYVAKTELATTQSNLDDYVTTQILEDVVEQINAKFDSQRRWTFKLTMNANTTTTTLNLSESIDDYNPVLSNSDGKHVLVYQETNNGFEMIVLTVTLSGVNLSVQADKQSKNNYDIYLSFDQTS